MRSSLAWGRLLQKYFGTAFREPETLSTSKTKVKKVKSNKVQTMKDEKGLVLKPGAMISGNWLGRKRYYSGDIAKINGDGTADVQYDDGDFEYSVPSSRLRRKSPDRIHPLYSDKNQADNDGIAFAGAFGIPNVDDESVLICVLFFFLGFVVYLMHQLYACVFS